MNTHLDETLRAIIVTALNVEFEVVRAHLNNVQEETHKEGTVYEQGTFIGKKHRWVIEIVPVGKGNAVAASETERAIAHFQPQVALFVGIAGGLKSKDVKLGDVVAATKVYGYESGKADTSFLPRPDVGNSTYAILQRAKAEARKRDWLQRLDSTSAIPEPHVFVEPIAAGEKVVSSTRSATWHFLQKHYSDALAVEMEGHGFLKATHANRQVESLIIRGISDLIDDKDEADKANFQDIAARHASAFAFEVLSNFSTINTSLHDEIIKGRDHLNRGRTALFNQNYSIARQHLSKAASVLDEKRVPAEHAQARYLQILALLEGKRPASVTLQLWHQVDELMRVVLALSPRYSYLYTFALFLQDFARNGWSKSTYLRDAQTLFDRMGEISYTAEDEENIRLLRVCQSWLMRDVEQ